MNTEHETAPAAVGRCNCDSDPGRRVLRQITPLAHWPVLSAPVEPTKIVAIIDSETTGFDPEEDAIIELAVALVEVDATGRICRLIRKGQGRQDPGRPIPPRITALTGISDADVVGRHFGCEAFADVLQQAQVVLAHNSGFDRKFVERLIPGIQHLPWACSMKDCDWLMAGFDGAKLGHLLYQIGLFAPQAHSALADVEALVNLLAHELPDGRTVLGEVLRNAEKPTMKIEAVNSAYSQRGELRRRGYRWDADRGVWWSELVPALVNEELAWLHERNAHVRPRVKEVTWHTRYQ